MTGQPECFGKPCAEPMARIGKVEACRRAGRITAGCVISHARIGWDELPYLDLGWFGTKDELRADAGRLPSGM